MTATTEPRSKKIRRRVACTVVATGLTLVAGVLTAPTASAAQVPGALSRPNFMLG
jgi:hypothetical protein